MKICLDCGQARPDAQPPTHAGGNRAVLCRDCRRKREQGRNQARTWYAGYWATLSAKARREQPWCSRCGTTGVPLELDHITPRSPTGGYMVLCKPCHRTKGR